MTSMSAGDEFPSWEPRELGFSRALLLAILLVAAITACCVWIVHVFRTQGRAAGDPGDAGDAGAVAETGASRLRTPPPARAAIPKPPPKPAPAVIPKPPPVPSPIAVATMLPPPPPPPPVRHVYKPAPHPVIGAWPRPGPPALAAGRAAPHRARRRHDLPRPQRQPAAFRSMASRFIRSSRPTRTCRRCCRRWGLSGTAVIEIVVAPNGKVLSARVAKSSGVPIIDATALDHARDAQLPPFNSQMPDQPHAFLVPIEIRPGQDD